jgi:hypothetical protein
MSFQDQHDRAKFLETEVLEMRARVAAQIAKSVDISTVPTPRLAKFMARDLGTTV